MQVNHFRRKSCRLCDSTNLTSVFSLTSTPPANAFVALEEAGHPQPVFPIELFFCEECHHVQLLDVVDPGYLFKNYVYVSGTSPVFVEHFAHYAHNLLDKYGVSSKASLIVDIGSNDGTFLRNFHNLGYKVLGVDPAKEIARVATESGIHTIPQFFSSELALAIRQEQGPASIISANNVFAHSDNLQAFVAAVCQLLAPEGIFSFEVSYLGDVFENVLFDTMYHEHLSYHSVAPLQRFLYQNGLELIEVQRINTHGGSIRCIAQHRGAARAIDASVAECIQYEHALKFNTAKTFKAFSNKIETLKENFLQLVLRLKAEGKSFAAYGAPAKATTLMYHFGIGKDLINFVIDDSPWKQNLLTPGMHVPVVSSASLYDKKPDEVIILAWNFAESIIKSHQRFLDAGGKFIIPLPLLRRI